MINNLYDDCKSVASKWRVKCIQNLQQPLRRTQSTPYSEKMPESSADDDGQSESQIPVDKTDSEQNDGSVMVSESNNHRTIPKTMPLIGLVWQVSRRLGNHRIHCQQPLTSYQHNSLSIVSPL